MSFAVVRDREVGNPPPRSETEALGQTGEVPAITPGSREYRRQVEKLIAGKITYEQFVGALERRRHLSRMARLRHFLRTLIEGLGGRSFTTRTRPR
mgnify:CR=1 FL=1